MKKMKKTSILERAKTVLKSTGTLGAASAGQFVDNFCDEVERTAYEQDGEPTATESCSQESAENEEGNKK